MKAQIPSPFFLLYRHLVNSVHCGKVFSRSLLNPILSWTFSKGVRLRNRLISKKPYRVRSTVVSVGNIVVGGAGKTPVVLWLAESLRALGYSCAVLSRGYRGRFSSGRGCTIVDGEQHQAKDVGDEPLLMARRLPKGSVWVHKDRWMTASHAAAQFDILILDDGLQYTKLYKDVEIVVVNGADPLGGGAFFPKGRLRDFPERLRQADFLVVNGACQRDLSLWCSAPQIAVEPQIARVIRKCTQEEIPLESLKRVPVGVFCGLGFPQGFLAMLKQSGIKVVGTYILPDHSEITEQELRYFCSKIIMRQGQYILCTEKDSVKLRACCSLPLGIVQMRFDILHQANATSLLNAISQIHNSKRYE